MCGRFTLTAQPATLAEVFGLRPPLPTGPRYNIAPTQPILALHRPEPQAAARWDSLHWGLIPAWAKDPKLGARLINARSETAAEKPSFRGPLRHRRCLIPADGFFEWRAAPEGKQPVYITLADRSPFAFAGLWDAWTRDGQEIVSCTILTTEANALVRPWHERMPVILAPQDHALWLDPSVTQPDALRHLFRPFAAERMRAQPVGRTVNNARNESPDCIAPLDAG